MNAPKCTLSWNFCRIHSSFGRLFRASLHYFCIIDLTCPLKLRSVLQRKLICRRGYLFMNGWFRLYSLVLLKSFEYGSMSTIDHKSVSRHTMKSFPLRWFRWILKIKGILSQIISHPVKKTVVFIGLPVYGLVKESLNLFYKSAGRSDIFKIHVDLTHSRSSDKNTVLSILVHVNMSKPR